NNRRSSISRIHRPQHLRKCLVSIDMHSNYVLPIHDSSDLHNSPFLLRLFLSISRREDSDREFVRGRTAGMRNSYCLPFRLLQCIQYRPHGAYCQGAS
ncbi:hypothetical protein PMAYCL1PPCAC_09075, partial [Pristionchus mayeri]